MVDTQLSIVFNHEYKKKIGKNKVKNGYLLDNACCVLQKAEYCSLSLIGHNCTDTNDHSVRGK